MTSFDPNPLPSTADLIADAPLTSLLQRARTVKDSLPLVASIFDRLLPVLEASYKRLEGYRLRVVELESQNQSLLERIRELEAEAIPPSPPPPPAVDAYGEEDLDILEVFDVADRDQAFLALQEKVTRFDAKIDTLIKAIEGRSK